MGLNIRSGKHLGPAPAYKGSTLGEPVGFAEDYSQRLRIVLQLEIYVAGIVHALGHRWTMLDSHPCTRNKHWETLWDLQRIILPNLRIVLLLEIWGARIVLGLTDRRSMLDPH